MYIVARCVQMPNSIRVSRRTKAASLQGCPSLRSFAAILFSLMLVPFGLRQTAVFSGSGPVAGD
jgi:hypothetical protein